MLYVNVLISLVSQMLLALFYVFEVLLQLFSRYLAVCVSLVTLVMTCEMIFLVLCQQERKKAVSAAFSWVLWFPLIWNVGMTLSITSKWTC